jgi:hypothetical protein
MIMADSKLATRGGPVCGFTGIDAFGGAGDWAASETAVKTVTPARRKEKIMAPPSITPEEFGDVVIW